jgi:predicted transcriptional regulator
MISVSLEQRIRRKDPWASQERPSPRKPGSDRYVQIKDPYHAFRELYAFGNGSAVYDEDRKKDMSPYSLLMRSLFPELSDKEMQDQQPTRNPLQEYSAPRRLNQRLVHDGLDLGRYHPGKPMSSKNKDGEQKEKKPEYDDLARRRREDMANEILQSFNKEGKVIPRQISYQVKSYWKMLGSYVRTVKEDIGSRIAGYMGRQKKLSAYSESGSRYRLSDRGIMGRLRYS